jgi:predicted DNA-binding protein
MHQNISSKKVRLNVQIPFELKDKLDWAAGVEGKNVSVLVRESLEDRLEHIEKKSI